MLDVSLRNLVSLQEAESNVLAMAETEIKRIEEMLKSVGKDYCNDEFAEFYWQCYKASFGLPESLHKKIFGIKSHAEDSHFLIQNLPVSQTLGTTPVRRGGAHCEASLEARKLMTVILARLGFIYGFSHKKYFDFIDDVFPLEADKHEQLGTNKDFLEWHVEDGFHEAKADWVALFCLRHDPNAHTYLFHAKDIDLDSKHMAALKRPDFVIEVDKTFDNEYQEEKRIAVLSEHCDPEIIYDPAYMRCLNPEAEKAFRELHHFISENKRVIDLRKGDLLIFDNRRTVHARSEYAPRYDGSDRWLLRALLLESKFKARQSFLPDRYRVL